MVIKNFTDRQKAQYLYDTYFDPDSKHCLDYGLFNPLEFYGAIDEGKSNIMDSEFNKIGDQLFNQIKEFDKKYLKSLKK